LLFAVLCPKDSTTNGGAAAAALRDCDPAYVRNPLHSDRKFNVSVPVASRREPACPFPLNAKLS